MIAWIGPHSAAAEPNSAPKIVTQFLEPSLVLWRRFCLNVRILRIKYPRYAAQTLPQTKLGRFDFLKTNNGKKLHEMSEDFTLYALEFIALLNEQNTIFKVVIGGAAVELLLQ